LVPKNAAGEDFVKKLKAAQESALAEIYEKKLPQNLERWGISDGDDTEDAVAKNHYIIKASSKSLDLLGHDNVDRVV
jgi:hypothetical protein